MTQLMHGNVLGELGTVGPTATISLPVEDAFPAAIAVDSYGSVWATLNQAGILAHRTASGDLNLVELPEGAAPVGIAVSGKAVWVADIAGSRVFQLDDGKLIREFALSAQSRPHAVVAAAFGCWFTEWGANRLGRIENGELVEYDLSELGEEPPGLALDNDSNVWLVFESGMVAGLRIETLMGK